VSGKPGEKKPPLAIHKRVVREIDEITGGELPFQEFEGIPIGSDSHFVVVSEKFADDRDITRCMAKAPVQW